MKINSAKLACILLAMVFVCLLIAPKHTQSLENSTVLDLLPEPRTDHLDVFVPVDDQPANDGAVSDILLPDPAAETQDVLPSSNAEKPRVLIYHTHLTEAYLQDASDQYKESTQYRTYDKNYNMAAVGDVLKSELEKIGFEVIHDTTDHEPPKLSTAYERSLITMEKYAEHSIDLYIDLHRDASGSANADDVVVIDGERCARMMFVVGKGLKSDGTEYDPKPNFEKTYALAETISENIKEYDDDFMREIRVKRGRYNQHISDNCILAEIGHNMNTLSEAKNAVVYLAQAIGKTFGL